MKRCVIDTNVLIAANKAVQYQADDDVSKYPALIGNSVSTLYNIKKKGVYVVLDMDDEIFNEYSHYLSFSGQPGVGDIFFKWLSDHRWSFPDSERVKIHKSENGYKEFPHEMKQMNIDPDDKKFFAVSNAHPSKPKIFEATDSKWWKWKDAAKKCGIIIEFMDEKYMRDHNREMR